MGISVGVSVLFHFHVGEAHAFSIHFSFTLFLLISLVPIYSPVTLLVPPLVYCLFFRVYVLGILLTHCVYIIDCVQMYLGSHCYVEFFPY